MRTASAYIYKLKNETKGKTFKVQDTNHRLMTGTIFRGSAGCGPVDFTPIFYSNDCCIRPPPVTTLYGGNPYGSGPNIYHGGTPFGSSPPILYGGSP